MDVTNSQILFGLMVGLVFGSVILHSTAFADLASVIDISADVFRAFGKALLFFSGILFLGLIFRLLGLVDRHLGSAP